MTLFTTSIRLINASIKGAITGAKDAVILEKQFMAWESELEVMEIFDGYEGWIESDEERYERLEREHLGRPEDETGIYARDCICCDNLYGTPTQSALMCDHCLSQDDQIDELPDFLKEDEYEDFNIFELDGASSCVKHKQFQDPYAGCHTCYEKSEYHMDTCSIEATGVCSCDLPF